MIFFLLLFFGSKADPKYVEIAYKQLRHLPLQWLKQVRVVQNVGVKRQKKLYEDKLGKSFKHEFLELKND